jgi:hypothetical protein
MVRGVGLYLSGACVLAALLALAGCSGRFLMGERETWRHEAETTCLSSGDVREGPGKVRISPIEGPGMCGADFPLKVSSLGNGGPLGYGDEIRPPAAIPGGAAMPRWPVTPTYSSSPSYPTPPAVTRSDLPPPDGSYGAAPPARSLDAPTYGQPSYSQPMSLDPPNAGAPPYDFRRPYEMASPPPLATPQSAPPRFGSPSVPRVMAAAGPVSVSPAATLACPIVSVLDEWFDDAVQPAALKWFGQPVVEIKQISAYSCRGMNGNPNATISEHAFGNALDIAAFTLADGRKISVEHGWRGAAEEQGFLHDVQAAACDRFTTVLAPGSNAYHYNHIHVDLMRRRNGHRACDPHAIPGDEVAARARTSYAAKRFEPSVTGALGTPHVAAPGKRMPSNAFSDERSARDLPDAVPGADGVE